LNGIKPELFIVQNMNIVNSKWDISSNQVRMKCNKYGLPGTLQNLMRDLMAAIPRGQWFYMKA
jgi:hypothetical protein